MYHGVSTLVDFFILSDSDSKKFRIATKGMALVIATLTVYSGNIDKKSSFGKHYSVIKIYYL